jgi:hypothetical protein
LIASLLELGNNSYALIDGLCQQSKEWQDFAEDFEEVEEFFTRQFDIWQQLRRALNDQFKSNRHALEQNPEAAKALAALQAIYDDKSPYSKLRQVGSLIDQLIAINLQLVEQKRAAALERSMRPSKVLHRWLLTYQLSYKTRQCVPLTC